jgi:hypothetical protein
MNGAAAAVAALAAVLVPVAAAGEGPAPLPPINAESPPLVALALPAQAGTRPVRLVLRLRGRLTCSPTPASITVGLAPAVRVPNALGSHDVLVDGIAASKAAVAGHVVTLTARPSPRACGPLAGDAITVVFTATARLGNPLAPGSYRIWMRVGHLHGVTTLLVH